MRRAIELAERGMLPDFLIRAGIRRLLAARIREISPLGNADETGVVDAFVGILNESPIAIETQAANEQHYEEPPSFFETVLGPRLKYSACLWEAGTENLAEAEEQMLQLTARRAGIGNGQRVLELGCGWGSFCLWAAEKFPGSQIVGVSNSANQRGFILGRAQERGLSNLEILTRDMNDFSPDGRFDRIVSIEMLEHLRNYRKFFARVRNWLEGDGAFFIHIFCHRKIPYAFEPTSSSDWMARHFFTGGIMPSYDLFERFDEDLEVREKWRVSGEHYSKTLEAWLERQDADRDRLIEILSRSPDEDSAAVRFQRWRMFFMACSELFRWDHGNEWFVGHYLLGPKQA